MGRFRRRFEMSEENNSGIRYNMALKRVRKLKGFYNHLAAYLIFNTIIILTNNHGKLGTAAFWQFQTFSIAFFWGIGLMAHAASVFGRNLFCGQQWEERKIKELMGKQKNHKWE